MDCLLECSWYITRNLAIKVSESVFLCAYNLVYTMDEHEACLRQLCRICGVRFGRDDRRYACSEYKTRISQVYSNVNVENDDPLVHPSDFCIGCYVAMSKCEKSRGALETVAQPTQWQVHSEYCPTCSSCIKQRKGGRPSKKSVKKRTATAVPGHLLPSLHTVLDHINKVAPLPYCPEESSVSLLPSEFIQPAPPLTIELFLCPLCTQVINGPVELPCKTLCCRKCAVQAIVSSGAAVCPLCQEVISKPEDIQCPSQITLMSLASLQVRCTQANCSEYVRLDRLQDHQCSCRQSTKSIVTPIQQTLRDVLQKPLDGTPNTAEKRVASHVIRRMVNSSCEQASDDFVSLKTGGRVSILHP